MIAMRRVTKSFPTPLGRNYVIRDVTADIPDRKNVAILGRNGAGKSTLLRLLGGIDYPDSGEIKTDQFMSWPLALSSGLAPLMTGRENTRFIARIHGVKDKREMETFVQDFAELGIKYDLPVKTYSSGMRARLAFGISMAYDFDTYLLDEVTSVGDPAFRRKAQRALDEKRGKANIIMVSHAKGQIREMCDFGIVLRDGQLEFFDDLDQAIALYEKL